MEETALVKAIGLDFGTTNSALAIAKSDGMVRLAQFRDGATFARLFISKNMTALEPSSV